MSEVARMHPRTGHQGGRLKQGYLLDSICIRDALFALVEIRTFVLKW